jgi:hypothetical protein
MLLVSQPGKKSLSLYRTRTVIALFRRARNLPLPWITSVQSTPPAFYFLKSILILFYHIHLGVSPQNPVYICLLPHLCDSRNVREKIKSLKKNSSIRLETLENSYPVTMCHIVEWILTPWTIKWTEHAIQMDKIKNIYKFIFGEPTWRSPPEGLDVVGWHYILLFLLLLPGAELPS